MRQGTGKTKTIVEAVFQILEHHPDVHILVCGASNSAADTLTDRLGQRLAPNTLFRLNDPSRRVIIATFVCFTHGNA